MTFKEWIIKNFNRNRAVIVYVRHEDKRITSHWCIKNSDNTVKVTGTDLGIVISEPTTYLTTKWNIPTYFIDHINCESMKIEKTIDLKDERESFYTAQEFRLILDNDEARKIFQASKSGTLSQENIIILAVIILGFLATFYFFNIKLNDIKSSLPEPVPVVETVETVEDDINE